MSPQPRLVDIFGPDKPSRMSRRRKRGLVTHDGTMIVEGESYPIAGEPIAFDERPAPSLDGVTFDGAVQPCERGR